MTLDLDRLEALAKNAQWVPCVPETCLLPEDLKAKVSFEFGAHPGVILALITEVRALREDKARLDSGCIVTYERDEFGEEYRCERRGNDLRAMIDAARREKA